MAEYHRARKRFGQNFLLDQNIIVTIIHAAELTAEDHVLEIGPGQGALTHKILPQVQSLDLIEIDRDLAQDFIDLQNEKLTVHVGDALRMDWDKFLPATNCKLIANLPYNISSMILFKMIEHRQRISRMVLMFQKEVGDRLRAQPGSKEYGALSVLCQLWFDVESIAIVPPTAFRPPPKVMSEVLRFTRLPAPRVELEDPNLFRKVVKAAFAQRRKTLRNCLGASGFSREAIASAEQLAAIDMQRRGETLSIQEFALLTKHLLINEPS
jgi:16S rRNA (adenine1518-N6/adenine1519-N6)-dimethyltransferase